ncbi:MAG: hypothetical protein P8012_05430, partial [Desulfobacterales bacterium]
MRISAALFILLLGTVAYAGGIETVIVPPDEISQAGQSMMFSVYFYNPGDQPLPVDLPASMMCRLSAGGKTIEVKADVIRSSSEKTMMMCPGCFEKMQYSLKIPSMIEGAVFMEIPDLKEAHAMLAVRSSGTLKKPTGEKTASKGYETLDSLFELYQPYIKNLSAYDPMYFLVGTDPKKSKFQISFKYRLFDLNSTLVQNHPWSEG